MESEPLVHLLQDKNSNASLEFCRLVNTATYEDWNTRGLKDEIGLLRKVVTKNLIHPILLVYHLHLIPIVIYRKMLNLYCPAKVTYLKCFGKVFDLLGFKAHLKAFLSPLIIFIFVFLHVLPVLHAIEYRRTQSARHPLSQLQPKMFHGPLLRCPFGSIRTQAVIILHQSASTGSKLNIIINAAKKQECK